ncbi:MAG: hypothetical protein RIF32_06305 [Leptospirales bacterium]|jgi:hypothetical protein
MFPKISKNLSACPNTAPVWIALVFFATMIFGYSLGAEDFEQDGLKIKVTRADETGGVPAYSVFQVVAENPTAEDRTLHAVIQLSWRDPGAAEISASSESSCVAVLEIPAGHRLTEMVPCEGAGFTKFAFKIQSVLPYLLDQSPLKWQKAEALK